MDVSLPAAGLPTTAATSSTSGPNKPAAPSPEATSGGHSFLWKGEDFSFDDVLDVINPLQHIPIVGTIYRAVTGDKPGHLSQLLGDTLFGGIAGAASSVVNIAVEEITGKDLGEQALAMVGLDGAPSTQYASASGQPIPHPPSKLQGYTRSLGDPEDRRGGGDDGDGGIMILTAQMRARIPAAEQPGAVSPQLAAAAVPGAASPASAGQSMGRGGPDGPSFGKPIGSRTNGGIIRFGPSSGGSGHDRSRSHGAGCKRPSCYSPVGVTWTDDRAGFGRLRVGGDCADCADGVGAVGYAGERSRDGGAIGQGRSRTRYGHRFGAGSFRINGRRQPPEASFRQPGRSGAQPVGADAVQSRYPAQPSEHA